MMMMMMMILSCTSRDMRNENDCGICSWSERRSVFSNIYVENIEAHYEDIESLSKLDVTHTLRCEKHVKNCAL